MSQNAILGGIRVLDLSQYLVGPHCTLLLSGMGAEVIRIDNPHSGDRSGAPVFYGKDGPTIQKRDESDIGIAFLKRKRGKKSITLDLKSEEGHALPSIGRARGRRRREFHRRRYRTPENRLADPAQDQSEARLLLHHRIRRHRPGRETPRLRSDDAGHVRFDERHRTSRQSADESRHADGRYDLGRRS